VNGCLARSEFSYQHDIVVALDFGVFLGGFLIGLGPGGDLFPEEWLYMLNLVLGEPPMYPSSALTTWFPRVV